MLDDQDSRAKKKFLKFTNTVLNRRLYKQVICDYFTRLVLVQNTVKTFLANRKTRFEFLRQYF